MDDLRAAADCEAVGSTTCGRATESGATAAHQAAVAVVSAIEKGELTSCPHCSGAALHGWGTGRKGVRRWRCRSCQRSFSVTTGTAIAGLHSPRKFAAVLADMMSDNPSSCRRLAETVKISRMTAWAWRQRISEGFAAVTAKTLPEPLAGDGCLVVRESRKASREWADHRRDSVTYPKPDRHRWIDYRRHRLPLPQPMTPYLIPVVLLRDRFSVCHMRIVPGPCTKPEMHGPAGRGPRQGSLTCPKSASATSKDALRMAIGARCERPPGLQTAAVAPRAAGAHPVTDCLKSFLVPFRGPATKYLFRYVAWFVARLNRNDGSIAQRLLSKECALSETRRVTGFPVDIVDCYVT